MTFNPSDAATGLSLPLLALATAIEILHNSLLTALLHIDIQVLGIGPLV